MASCSCLGNGIFLLKFFWDNFKNVLDGTTIFEQKYQRRRPTVELFMLIYLFSIFINKRVVKSKSINFKEVFGDSQWMAFLPFGWRKKY